VRPHLLLRINTRLLIATLAAIALHAPPLRAQQPSGLLPRVFRTDAAGTAIAVDEDQLCNCELNLRDEFARVNAPDHVFALAVARRSIIALPDRGIPVSLFAIVVHGKQAELRVYEDGAEDEMIKRYYARDLSAEEIQSFSHLLTAEKVDELPDLQSDKTMGGTQYVYLHLEARKGHRVLIDGSSLTDVPESSPKDEAVYLSVIKRIARLADDDALTACYRVRRPISGFEVSFARRGVEVLDVWRQASELCVRVKEKRDPDAVAKNYIVRNRKLGAEIGPRVGMRRSSVDLGGTKLAMVRTSHDGRWIVGSESSTGQLKCYDAANKRFVPLGDQRLWINRYPLYYLSAHNGFVLGRFGASKVAQIVKDGSFHCDGTNLRVLDPESGETSDLGDLPGVEATVDDSLWFQDLPDQLQPVAGRENAVWVAIPSTHATDVYQMDTKQMRFISGQTVPNFRFNSSAMVVDQPGSRIHFVYYGQLLSVPLVAGK
jgi:hypothetical protein